MRERERERERQTNKQTERGETDRGERQAERKI